jgi:predicted aconitase
VALFHAVGITPEAPTLDDALAGAPPAAEFRVDGDALRAARDDLTTAVDGPLAAVSVGTPHFSIEEFRALAPLLDGRSIAPGVDVFVNTGRDVLALAAAEGLLRALRAAGVEIVTDTCTYITPILRETEGVVMTNSGKWAYYAPSNLGVDVAFGSLEDCVASAVAGRVVRDEAVWGG